MIKIFGLSIGHLLTASDAVQDSISREIMADLQQDRELNRSVDQSLVLTSEIIRLLHQASVDRDVALSALVAATSHVQCMNKADTV